MSLVLNNRADIFFNPIALKAAAVLSAVRLRNNFIVGAKKPATGGKPAEQKPKEKVWTKEDDMARRIQTKYRQHRAKKLLEKKKKEKQDYEELMEKLEKEVA